MLLVLSPLKVSESKRATAIVLTCLLAIAGLTSISTSASANTAANPSIIFDGNTLAISVPASEVATRVSADSLRLSTESLTRSVSTTRTGYSFGGWSLSRGGAATNEITTSTTSDTTRTLFAVWNTTVSYGTNGADSGTLPANRTSEQYRFGQALILPTAGTLVKSGYAFGGWMTSTVSANRFTTYLASNFENGNPTLYVSWIKTVTFNGNGSTSGTIPSPQVFVAGGPRLVLPTLTQTSLRRAGYDFLGWSTTASGTPLSGSNSYVPLASQQTLYAVWRVQTTKAITRIFFNPGKSILRPSQKLVIRELVDSIRGKNNVTLHLISDRSTESSKALRRARKDAAISYIRSLGLTASYVRENRSTLNSPPSTRKATRLTIKAFWEN